MNGYAAAAPAQPLMIENPHVRGAAAAQAKMEAKPLMIDNPYFVAK
jgi:hypothetical protein